MNKDQQLMDMSLNINVTTIPKGSRITIDT